MTQTPYFPPALPSVRTMPASVKDGIVMQRDEQSQTFKFYRINGSAGMHKVLVQVAECCTYPSSIGGLVWDNHGDYDFDNIPIFGVLVQPY